MRNKCENPGCIVGEGLVSLPADQSSYSKEMFGEFTQCEFAEHFLKTILRAAGRGHEPLPYAGDWAMRVSCNSPFCLRSLPVMISLETNYTK